MLARRRAASALSLALLGGCAANVPGLTSHPVASSARLRSATVVRQVAGMFPVAGHAIAFGADRPLGAPGGAPPGAAKTNRWKLLATLPGAVVHDIAFPTVRIGYAAAELGQVWKTTDGGANWTEIVNVGFPYYWFGVKALSARDVVISGFNDSNYEGIIRWSHDGGATWTQDIVLTTTGWSYRVRFANRKDGLVLDGLSTVGPNAAHYTVDGGAAASDWTSVVPDPNGGWFGNEFSLLPNLAARASGITYCSSSNGGQTWTCGHSVDSVFDGPVFFANNRAGWVGGGEISPQVAGWVHRTTDGGKTWSGRTLQSPFPIRELRFLTPATGWAAGGNIYSNVGGIYFSSDGGKTWVLDLDTNGSEMDACDSLPAGKGYEIWCAGYNGSLNGVVYATRYP
jgi:photosystem II stability/assembly factor-like uncharacterized protein